MMLDVAKQEKDRIIRSRCINLLMMEITRMRRIWETSNPACSNAASADSLRNCKTEPNPCSYARQHSNISFSSLTGESSAGEYHLDCDASSMLLMGDPPRCNPGAGPDQTTTPSGSRSDVVSITRKKRKCESESLNTLKENI
ncbi:hypothetical protein HanRHA438_Chr00c48g0858351 [Helianthus annuus]|uniref:Uncharacterized protein n=1 Tax=Helianthus annuus TaxID=4232 RepID=A0A9K3H5D1_HELAN|nr:hypothetical protein HanXRQr2_Chr15g0702991 [Helianthus annuus]KAJ0451908.1 hypothetical protein HanHA300_Chr15g0572931 [Helianthus annuus]KAJ0473793.1 hypothetical protein HanHA89_Chr15g0622411 [Helianthus annuus]KAJ0653171.1 hypothetical protein HanOQP8_Chr15g0580531 [Helianthus annuus]KAJ0832064.1 hypothetical protein HanPSC8_Chr15g0674451 [Helianthus annuus]